MKKLTRIAGIILLLVTVSYTGLAIDVASVSSNAFGFVAQGGLKVLREGIRNENIIRLATIIGGVIFQETAVPTGNAIGQPVAIQYDSAQADGRRMILTIGNTAVITELYDWEMIPIAQFVESGYTACMTLFDEPRTDDEIETHINNLNKSIMWANFHPALGDTIIGLNLFFVDAMLVNPDLMQFADEVFTAPIPGYHITGRNLRNMSRERRIENTTGIELLLKLEQLYLYRLWYGDKLPYRKQTNSI